MRNIRKWHLAWFMGAVALLVAGTTLLVAGGLVGKQPDGIFAYMTDRGVVVMRGDQRVVQIPRIFDVSVGLRNTVVWTNSGQFVALLSDATVLGDEASTEDLLYADVRTGRTGKMPCPGCYDITPIGDDAIAALTSTGDNPRNPIFGIRHLDLAHVSSDPPKSLALPAAAISNSPQFLGGTRRYLLVSQSSYGNTGNVERLMLLDAAGKLEADYGLFRSEEFMSAAVTEDRGSTEPRMAVVFRRSSGGCAQGFTISVLTRRHVTRTSMAFPGSGVGRDVRDVWWDRDGGLHASVITWTCDQADPVNGKKVAGDSYEAAWQPVDGRWGGENFRPATMIRTVDARTRVELRIPVCLGPVTQPEPEYYCNTGKLFRYRSGGRKLLAEDVVLISVPRYLVHASGFAEPSAAPVAPTHPVDSGSPESPSRGRGTSIIRIDPFTLDGSIRRPYSVESVLSVDDIDCSFDTGSEVALTGGTHSCGATADNANACWASARYPEQILCLASAWDTVLHARRTPRIVTTQASQNPLPLGMELADGSQWWRRVGGAWGGRADGYSGAYVCRAGTSCDVVNTETDLAVLTREGTPVIDKSGPVWTVLVGELGDPSHKFPLPKRMAVVRAYFIASSLPSTTDGRV